MNAHDVAAELRRRLPGLPIKKLHKLLYSCQGHHLVGFDQPLFTETISAYDMGPVVAQLWWAERHGGAPSPTPITDEAALNTIGYVLSRYGALTGKDLESLTHREAPYLRADENRPAGGSARIEVEWIRDYFRTADEDDTLELDPSALIDWLRDTEPPDLTAVRLDSREELFARLGPR